MSRALRWLPGGLLLLLLAGLAWRLATPPDPIVRSRQVGRPLPAFVLPAAVPAKPTLRSADLASGQPRLLNIFASWCVPCIAEARVLSELRRQGLPIDGLAIRDKPQDVVEFLRRHGDPFDRIAADYQSQVQLALGSSGVPETFIVDGKGIIRYQHVGPIEPEDVPAIVAEFWKAR